MDGKNYPEFASSLQPGLTREEVNEKIKDLPFKFSEEIYELYQWRNGDAKWDCHDGLIPLYAFLPLEAAIDEYASLATLNDEEYPDCWHASWFPIFRWVARCHYIVPMEKIVKATLPVLVSDLECGSPVPAYLSLTEMMLISAEACTTGVYCFDEYGRLEEDEVKLSEIFRRRYPARLEEILQELQSQALTENSLSKLYSEIVRFRDPRAVEHLIHLLESGLPTPPDTCEWEAELADVPESIRSLVIEIEVADKNARIQTIAASLLGYFNEPRAVEALNRASQHKET